MRWGRVLLPHHLDTSRTGEIRLPGFSQNARPLVGRACSPAAPWPASKVCCPARLTHAYPKENTMTQIIYIVGAVVIVLALLSFVGLR